MSRLLVFVLALVGLCNVTCASAGESLFGWLYMAEIHPPGTAEYEHKSFLQQSQSRGHYSFLKNQEEIEYGVTDRLQLAGYLNWTYANAARNGIDGTTGGPGVSQFRDSSADPFGRYSRARFDTVAAEFIYQVLNPITDPIGLALYAEPEIGPAEFDLEWKLILQKNLFDDRLILAANVFGTIERETTKEGEIEKASPLDVSVGASYHFVDNWFAGFEARIHNEFSGYAFNSAEHSAFFVGPVLHYATKDFWVTAAWRHQLPMVATYNEDQRAVSVGGRIYGDEHARDEIMFRVGVPF